VFRPYISVMRASGAALPLVASFLGSLPISMLTLGVLLLVQSSTGSFSSAGIASGALSAGNACGLLVQGRLIDRHGQTRVLLVTGLGCTTWLILLTVATTRHLPLPLVVTLAGAAGAFIPATISSMRVLWPTLVSRTQDLETAYALLAVQFHVAMITGPLVVSGVLLLAGPSVAVLVAAGLAGSSAVVFASTAASRRWNPSGVRRSSPRRTALATPGIRTLLVAALAGGVAFGLISVAIPATAVARGAPALAGILFACVSVGELVGGTAYGARSWSAPRARRLLLAQAAGSVGAVGVALMSAQPMVMMVALLIFGALHAPAGIAASSLLDDVAAKGTLTQSYTAMVAAGLIGGSLGNSVGGMLENATASWVLFVASAGAMGATATWILLRMRSLTPGQTTPAHSVRDRHGSGTEIVP
jgi:MFS family permease